jgi:hypothetical protein
MTVLLMAWRSSAIPPSYLSSSLLRKQLCTVESFRRLHGTLIRQPLPISRSAFCSPTLCARFATSSQHIQNPLKTAHGSWKMQHRFSSTKGGPSRVTDAKSTKSNHTQTDSFKDGNRLPESNDSMTIWQKFLAPKPMPERHSASWYREIVLICTVFAITGSTTMLVRILIYGSLLKHTW